ncbi:MAG: DNA polymerase I [Rhabdochlamydiaceae bacterium]|nr:DNA polymerase I [Candidatus Amphrikana amoebophyrae]
MKNSLYILDAANFLFRSFYAIKGMQNKKGLPTNALFGFIRSIEKVIKDFSPSHMAIVFDGPNNKESRKKIYSEYKSHREKMPDELAQQMDLAHKFCDLYGLSKFELSGVEADDTIGSITEWAKNDEHLDVYILSTDKDLCQLVNGKCKMINVPKGNMIIDSEKVEELHGVKPSQIIDLLAIMGDSADNIPGIKGFGPKTATKLLTQFGSLDGMFENLSELANPKQREKILTEKENALISYQLATINRQLDIPRDLNAYQLSSQNTEELREFYKEMDFSAFLRNLDQESEPKEEKQEYSLGKSTLINDEKSFEALLKNLEFTEEICFDTESTSLDKMEAKLVGIGLSITSDEAFYIPLNGQLNKDQVLSKLKPIFESDSHKFIGHNIKYDMHVLANHGIGLKNIGFDTMVASYLIHPERNRHGLDYLTEDLFGHTKVSFKELTKVEKKQVGIDEIDIEAVCQYCAEDVLFTYKLKELFEPQIAQLELEQTFYQIEMPLLPVLFEMEREGIYVDKQKLLTMSDALTTQLKELEIKIYELATEEFNIKSPKQLSHILFEVLAITPFQKKKASGYSTSIDVLEKLTDAHPIIKEVIEFRSLEKLRSTYVDALPLQINNRTQRIHCNFSQTTTATGRLASTDPNLQNIPIRTPIGRTIREAFIPAKNDWSYLSADYSQIELRIVAHLSEDKALIDAFLHSADVHTATAALIFDVSEQQVTKEMRYRAKAVNFGIIYGQQAFGLSKEIGIDIKEAAKFIRTYFERYPGVDAFLQRAKNEAKVNGYTFTACGRRRPLPELKSKNSFIRAQAERYAVNTPIQGTQADLIKMAMIEIANLLKQKNLKSKMILQIHDELFFEMEDSERTELTKLVKETMENIYQLKVPLKVDISVGKNWGEC